MTRLGHPKEDNSGSVSKVFCEERGGYGLKEKENARASKLDTKANRID